MVLTYKKDFFRKLELFVRQTNKHFKSEIKAHTNAY